jgi:hypothetical protein
MLPITGQATPDSTPPTGGFAHPLATSGGTVRWVLAKEFQAEIACVVRPLNDGVDVQVTYDGLLIGGRVCHDEWQALMWAEERRREWLARGWSDLPNQSG